MSRSTPRRRAVARRDDGGFTVLEVTVAIAIVTIVMTSLAAFFINSAEINSNQGEKQTAVRVATDAVEKARSLTAVGLTLGRDQKSSQALWADGANAAKFPGVATYQTDVTMAYDDVNKPADNTGYTAQLPTNGKKVVLDGVTYTQNWFLGTCLRTTTGVCSPTTGVVRYIRLIVAVTWTNTACSNSVCSYVTATFVSPTQDPEFDASKTASKPRINNPGNQQHETGQTVSLPVTLVGGATPGGTAPYTWTAPPTLPAGLTWGNTSSVCPSSSVCIYGVPTTVTPSGSPVQVTLKVTDAFGYTSTATFDWTITPGPSIAYVAARTTRTGTADTLNLSLTGGTAAYDWSKTSGLPPGMSIGTSTTSTAKITGTPTVGGSFTVTLKVVDAVGAVDTETFVWTIQLGGNLNGGATTGPSGGVYTCTWDVDVYGSAPFTWTGSDSRITITTSNGTSHAKFVVKVPYGTYDFTFAATQTSSGAMLNGYSTCYAGTK